MPVSKYLNFRTKLIIHFLQNKVIRLWDKMMQTTQTILVQLLFHKVFTVPVGPFTDPLCAPAIRAAHERARVFWERAHRNQVIGQ